MNQAVKPPPGWVAGADVEIDVPCNTDHARLFENVAYNSRRDDVPWIEEVAPHDRHAVIVGGGPSLQDNIEGIRQRVEWWQEVVALNNAARYVSKCNIPVKYQVIIDARPDNINFIFGSPAGHLLLASQCHPGLFAHFRGTDRVRQFHMAMDGIAEHLPKGRQVTLIGGGFTAGLTALALCYALGYRQMHLYGYDSSDADNGASHAYRQDKTTAEQDRLEIQCAGKTFNCSWAMYKQAENFPTYAQKLADAGVTLTVHGTGLLPTIALEMVKQTGEL